MGRPAEIEIEGTLRDAVEVVLGELPTSAAPVEVLAAYVFSLVKGRGLGESRYENAAEHERPELPLQLRSFVAQYLPINDDDSLRNALYTVFVALSEEPSAGKMLNGNRPLGRSGLLLVAQTAWNLERNEERSRLPLSRTSSADIVDPKTGRDFARMDWTERSNLKGVPGRSSGGSFRKQVARLAVLAAKQFVESIASPTSGLGDAQLEVSEEGRRAIVWREVTSSREQDTGTAAVASRRSVTDGAPVLVGGFAELAGPYERRGFDDTIERMWADGGNRRVWLRGGPGLGKSFAARRVMQESLVYRGDSNDELLIWVDSADATSVVRELARAAERMPGLGISVTADAAGRDERLARALLDVLRTTEIRWLIVFDGANAEELIEQNLLPPGTNPNGRVLITTLGVSHADAAGREVRAEQFSPAEADRFLSARLLSASARDRAALAASVGHHPLVLAMAAATISAERMTVQDWLAEFVTAQLDEVADHRDTGGYPHPLTATWQVALSKASRGLADGVAARAAMVAAIQNPDGHPSWLWQREAVVGWVDADSTPPRRSRRIHPAVKRLVDYGILQLMGDWTDGRVAIHQMAARAVRESSDPALLARLASILAKEWILQLTENPARAQAVDVLAAIRPLDSLNGLDTVTQDAVTALLDFAEPFMGTTLLREATTELDELEPHLIRGGVTGRINLAERHADIGERERDLGRRSQARSRFSTAYEIYEHLAEDPSLGNELRAKTLTSMAELSAALDQPERAQELRLQAVRIREHLAEPATPLPSGLLSNLIALTDLHQGLADDTQGLAALEQAVSELAARTGPDTNAAAEKHAELARRLASYGRVQEAIEQMHRSVQLYQTSDFGRALHLDGVRRELGMLYARQGEWSEAELWLARGHASALLLASVQLHMGHTDAARESLERAARAASETRDWFNEQVPDALAGPRDELVAVHIRSLAHTAWAHARVNDAADLATINLEIVRARAGAVPSDNSAALADAYSMAGLFALSAGRPEAAVALLRNSVSISELNFQLDSKNVAIRLDYGNGLVRVAYAHLCADALDDAIDLALRGIGVLEPVDGAEPQATDLALSVLAHARTLAGATDEAIQALTKRVDRVRGRLDPKTPDRASGADLVDALRQLISVCTSVKRWSEAVQPSTELVELCQTLVREDADAPDQEADLALALTNLAVVYSNADEFLQAEALARRAVTIRAKLLHRDPSTTERQAMLAYALAVHSESLRKLGLKAEARATLTDAANHLQLPAELNPSIYLATQIQLLRELAHTLREDDHDSDANEVSARADDLEHRFPDHRPDGA